MMKKINNCPICNYEKHKLFLSTKDFMLSNESFNIVVCESCKFHFTNPIPNEEEIGKYYKSDEYISHSSTKKNIIYIIYHFVRMITLRKKLKLITSLSKSKKILDYGSGSGHFLNLCNKKGFEVIGVEQDSDAIESAKNMFNLSFINPSELYKIENSSMDFITLWHVLEHVYDLDKTLIEFKRILKKNGFLIVAVPNLNSYDAKFYNEFWAAYDLPRHIYHFTIDNMKDLADKYSLNLIKYLPMKWDSYYVSMLSEKYKKGNIFNAIKVAYKSNLSAKNSNEFSSLIYIFSKKD